MNNNFFISFLLLIILLIGCRTNRSGGSGIEKNLETKPNPYKADKADQYSSKQEGNDIQDTSKIPLLSDQCKGINLAHETVSPPKKSKKALYFLDPKNCEEKVSALTDQISIFSGNDTYTFQIFKCNADGEWPCTKKDGDKWINTFSGTDCGCSLLWLKINSSEKCLMLDNDVKLQNLHMKKISLAKEEALLIYGSEPSQSLETDGLFRLYPAMLIVRIDTKRKSAYAYLHLMLYTELDERLTLCDQEFDCDILMVDTNDDTVGEFLLKSTSGDCAIIECRSGDYDKAHESCEGKIIGGDQNGKVIRGFLNLFLDDVYLRPSMPE